jgi:hypothetical protein
MSLCFWSGALILLVTLVRLSYASAYPLTHVSFSLYILDQVRRDDGVLGTASYLGRPFSVVERKVEGGEEKFKSVSYDAKVPSSQEVSDWCNISFQPFDPETEEVMDWSQLKKLVLRIVLILPGIVCISLNPIPHIISRVALYYNVFAYQVKGRAVVQTS